MARKIIINATSSEPINNHELECMKFDIENGHVSHIVRFLDGHEYEYRVGLLHLSANALPMYRILCDKSSDVGQSCDAFMDTKMFLINGYSDVKLCLVLIGFVEPTEEEPPVASKALGSVWEYLTNKDKEEVEKAIVTSRIDELKTRHGVYKIVTVAPICCTAVFSGSLVRKEEEHLNCIAVSEVNRINGAIYCIEADRAYDFIQSPDSVRPVRMKYIKDVIVATHRTHNFNSVDPGSIVYSKNRSVKHLITSVDNEGVCVSDLGHMTYKVAFDKLSDEQGNPFGIPIGK